MPWLLIVAGVLAYSNSLAGPFIFDDLYSIKDNQHIRQLWPPSWLTAPPRAVTNARPVVSFSFALNYAIGGLDVRGYHLVNLAVHILCALVLFGVVRRTLLGEKLRSQFGSVSSGIALACSLLWMLHPLQTECVNYLSQRTESLMALFYFLTLYCVIRAADSSRRRWWHGAAVLSCAVGMASKQAMVTAPIVVLLYDRVFRSDSFARLLRERWRLYAGLASSWIILAALVWSFPDTNIGFANPVGPLTYAMNQCVVVVDYLRLALWPHPLAFDYGYPAERSIGEVIPYAALLAALLTATVGAFVYRPKIGFLAATVFIVLSPTSSFIPLITEVGAERRMYVPSAGLIALLVFVGYALLGHLVRPPGARDQAADGPKGGRTANWCAGVLVLAAAIALGWTTVRRNDDYRSASSIWGSAVEAKPDGYRAHLNLGIALKASGRLDEAIHHYHQALQIKLDYAEAYNSLGAALRAQGRLDEAIRHFDQALQISPDYPAAHNNLGLAFEALGQPDRAMEQYRLALLGEFSSPKHRPHYNLGNSFLSRGKLDEAIHHYREALRANPNYAEAHNNLGVALQSQGNFDAALEHYLEALRLNPEYAEAHKNAGIVLQARGSFSEAFRHFRLALRITPNDAETHNNLAVGLAMTGRLDGALEQFRAAIRLNPEWPAPLNNLARILATHWDPKVQDAQRAVELAERAAELTQYRDASVLDTLAAAYAAAGQFDRAVTTAQRAAALAATAGQAQQADAIRARQKLYEQGQPYCIPVSDPEP